MRQLRLGSSDHIREEATPSGHGPSGIDSLINRMERINEQVGAAKRQSSADATLAESRYDIGFGGARRAQPASAMLTFR
jgi:hypothetical protein